MTKGHNERCRGMALECLQDNCPELFIAAIWDRAACEAETIRQKAIITEWLTDGTKSCECK